jgi:hypothetical protein
VCFLFTPLPQGEGLKIRRGARANLSTPALFPLPPPFPASTGPRPRPILARGFRDPLPWSRPRTTIFFAASRDRRRWGASCAPIGCPPACPRRWPNPTARRCARGFWAKISSSFATQAGGSACLASIARIARPRSLSDATKSAGCAASITAGNSTSTATCSTWPASPKAAASRPSASTNPIRHAKAAASSGFGWARPTRCANGSRRCGRPRPRHGSAS